MSELKYKEHFTNHEATVELNEPNHMVILFKNPKSNGFWVRFIINETTLIVLGDCDEAIYRWSGPISLPFLAGCNIGYFQSKCEASGEGKSQKTFAKNSNENLMKHVVEHVTLNHMSEEIADEISGLDLEFKFKECIRYVLANFETEYDDLDYVVSDLQVHDEYDVRGIYDNAHELEPFIGTDFWEYSWLFEEMTSTPQIHLAALQVLNEKYPDLI